MKGRFKQTTAIQFTRKWLIAARKDAAEWRVWDFFVSD